jgi:hypothetical protein
MTWCPKYRRRVLAGLVEARLQEIVSGRRGRRRGDRSLYSSNQSGSPFLSEINLITSSLNPRGA